MVPESVTPAEQAPALPQRGAWHVAEAMFGNSRRRIVADNGDTILELDRYWRCSTSRFDTLGERDEKAALIAAAPELLVAVQALVDLHHDWDSGRASVTVAFKAKNDAAIAAARSAVAKAKARQ